MSQEPAEDRFDDITIFTTEDGATRVEVRFQKENVWLTQKLMAELYECSTDNVGLHLKKIFAERELDPAATTEESSVVQNEGGLNVRILDRCRVLYRTYPVLRSAIPATASPEFLLNASDLANLADTVCRIPATLSPESRTLPIRGSVTRELPTPLSPQALLQLSWSKLVELLAIADPWKRALIEADLVDCMVALPA